MSLKNKILQEIARTDGVGLAASRVMELALYDSDYGYYGSGQVSISQEGDFVTSISVGAAYGQLIAIELESVWNSMGQPDEFLLVEQGAFDGQLLHDLLTSIQTRNSELWAKLRVRLIEPFGHFREKQAAKLSVFDALDLEWLESPQELDGCGYFYANELLDAFAVEQYQNMKKAWHQRYLVEKAGELHWVWEQPPELPTSLPDAKQVEEGYRAEFCPGIEKWWSQWQESRFEGIVRLVDYGWSASEYYASHRSSGHLQFYKDHQVIKDPLAHLGECDWSCHVNFTQIAQGGEGAGFQVRDFQSQESWLIDLAAPSLLEIEKRGEMNAADKRFIEQLRSLTHPAFMGRKFHALGLTKGLSVNIDQRALQKLEV